MLKTTLIALLVLVSTTTHTAFAATGTAEVFFQPEEGGAHPACDLFLAHRFDRRGLGVSAFTLMTEGWSEALIGPTWAPTDWLELGASIGAEQVSDGLGWRFSASLWAGQGPLSFLGIVEFNPQTFQGDNSGVWFDLTPRAQIMSRLTAGAKWRRGVGVGPLAEISIPPTPIALWASWMPIDPERVGGATHPKRFLIGAQGRF